MALKWISSYLCGRYFRVSVGSDLSASNAADGSNDSTSTRFDKFWLEFGGPQASVLRPLFFILYLCSIGDIIRKHSINFHIYFDDIPLYMVFDPKIDGAAELSLSKLSSCITDIYELITRNMLILNNSKTEFLLAASPHNLAKLHKIHYKLAKLRSAPRKR